MFQLSDSWPTTSLMPTSKQPADMVAFAIPVVVLPACIRMPSKPGTASNRGKRPPHKARYSGFTLNFGEITWVIILYRPVGMAVLEYTFFFLKSASGIS